jgi:hypothetical protein
MDILFIHHLYKVNEKNDKHSKINVISPRYNLELLPILKSRGDFKVEKKIMNAFQADIAFSLTLIALVMGTRLIMDVCTAKDLCCGKFYKAVGYLVVAGSLLTLFCVLSNAYKEYKNPPMGMNMPRNMGPRPPRPMMMPPNDMRPAIPGNAGTPNAPTQATPSVPAK